MNQAAQKLFISQPSLSAAIRELEDEVGIEIFRRTNRGIQVTPDGEEFVGYARQVVEQYALIEARYVDKEKVKKSSAFPCSIIRLRCRHSWRWSDASGWNGMNFPSMRHRRMM